MIIYRLKKKHMQTWCLKIQKTKVTVIDWHQSFEVSQGQMIKKRFFLELVIKKSDIYFFVWDALSNPANTKL